MRVPRPDCSWQKFCDFALSYNGYLRYAPGIEPFAEGGLAEYANAAFDFWEATGRVPATLHELRCCLFFEQRRAGHGLDMTVDPKTLWEDDPADYAWFVDYCRALMVAISELSRGYVDAPDRET